MTTTSTAAGLRVFLSHSTKDAAFVERLADALTAAGFAPWLCEVDIDIGENFVSRINQGLAQSDVALLLWSQHAVNSRWTEEEWTAALARQVEENRIRLGIILLPDCPMPLPPLLRTKNYIDARFDQPSAFRKIVEWLERRQSVQRFLGLPDYRPQDFVGRTVYLEQLRGRFAEPAAFLVHGEPGAGESTLALRFAWEAQKDFDAVIFQLCGQRPLDAITAELADRLPIDVKTRPPEEQRAAAKAWLRQRQSLLVLDDVWSLEVKELAPGPPCSVLYTSRRQFLPWIPPAETVRLEKFTEAEAEELFHAYLDSVFGEGEVARQREALLAFARQVELLPIAVAVGANILRQKAASALHRAVLKIQLNALSDGARDVNGLFRTAIESRTETEQKLLAACAICVQEGFWLPLAAEIAALAEDDAEDAADQLVSSSLLRITRTVEEDRERRRFNLHALLRDQLRARLGRDDLAILQELHAAVLKKLFADREKRWKDCRECLEEIIPAVTFLSESGGDSRAGELSFQGYDIAEVIGELDASFRIVKQWESVCEQAGNKDGLQASYGNQALILHAWGRLEEAMALHEKQEAICLELDNKDGLQRSYGNQALILQAWGRLEEAMALQKKEEAICLELGDKNSLQASYGNQAVILNAWGRLEEAMARHKKQEAICLELGNKNDLQGNYGNQALILKDWGRLEEAMALYKKQEAICLELGNKDGLSRSYANQANILRKNGQFEQALTLYEKAEVLGLELGSKIILGYCYWQWVDLARAQGDLKTAKQKLQQALAIFTELKMPRERDAAQAELDKLGLDPTPRPA